ncbi:hypothetical protein CBM2586_B130488 [Cupriavidus phytorum]|uniref:Uncharacterized protein n=1 Tax=Cupriavidus taiwanensis TaxID=164546 RepID=A0A975XIN4_9BURK|nr:hypothetical protein CBM2586_B130488 [Cupriavidus taiwanensis]
MQLASHGRGLPVQPMREGTFVLTHNAQVGGRRASCHIDLVPQGVRRPTRKHPFGFGSALRTPPTESTVYRLLLARRAIHPQDQVALPDVTMTSRQRVILRLRECLASPWMRILTSFALSSLHINSASVEVATRTPA